MNDMHWSACFSNRPRCDAMCKDIEEQHSSMLLKEVDVRWQTHLLAIDTKSEKEK